MTGLGKTATRSRAACRALAPHGTPHRRQLLHGALATLLLVGARLSFPWPLRGLLEIVFNNHGQAHAVVRFVPHRGDPALWLIAAFVVVILVWGVAESRQRLAFTRYAVGLSQGLRDALLTALPDRSGHGSSGDVISTLTGDLSRVKTGVKSILIGLSRNGVFFLGVTVIVSLIDRTVGLVFLLGGLATVVAGAFGASRSAVLMRRSRRREGALADDLHRFLAGDPSRAPRPRVRDRRPDSKMTRVENLTTVSVHVILAGSTCGILLLTIHHARSGQLTPGAVFTILAYILLMHNKTVGLGRSVVRAGRVLPSAERIAAALVHRPSGSGGRTRVERPPEPAPRVGPMSV